MLHKLFPYLFSACLLLAALPATGQKATRPSVPIFSEVADQVGLDFQHYNGATGQYYLPEIMGAGVALLDFDNDGDLDIFLTQGTVLDPQHKPAETLFPWRGAEPPRGRLYRNDLVIAKDGSRQIKLTDVTAQSGIKASGYGMGAATGDFNNDGWLDLYLCNLGSNQLWRNNGDGTFTDVTAQTHTDDPRWSSSAAFFDY